MPNKVIAWVEEHPWESVAIGAGGLIVMIWLLGGFSKKSSGDGGTANMAAAYYAAEAQQAVVGGQIQVANIQATRDTAITGLETDAAVKLGFIQANAATTINQQNADVSTTLGNQQLLATYSNNATAEYVTNSNNNAAMAITDSNNRAAIMTDWFHNVLPAELATYGSINTWIPGVGHYASGAQFTPDQARAAGWSESQIAALMGGY